jgi:hypothetical protein
MSTLLERESGQNISHTDLTFSTSEQESYNDAKMPSIALLPPSNGGWCLVSIDSIVYSDFSNDLTKSNTLSVILLEADETTSELSSGDADFFSLSLEDVADTDLLTTLPRQSHNITCSQTEFGLTLLQACPHNITHELLCEENSAGVWEVTCPSVTTNMTCASVRPEATGLAKIDAQCEVKSMSSTSIVCECPMSILSSQPTTSTTLQSDRFNVRRSSSVRTSGDNNTSDDSEVADVEFIAMVSYVVEDFVSTWSSVRDLSPSKVEQSKAALLMVASVVIFIAMGMLLTDNADKKHVADSSRKTTKSKEKYSLAKEQQVSPMDTVSGGSGEAVVDLDALFPSILTEVPFIILFYEEIKKSHRWASIYFNYDKNFPRSMRFLLLVSILICTLFFSALLYNISDPDDGSCETYGSEETCLHEPSQFSSQDTKCYWRGTGDDIDVGKCRFKEASSSAMTVIYVSMMSAILAVPFIFLLEYVVMDVLCRPTAVERLPKDSPSGLRKKPHHHDSQHIVIGAVQANTELRELVSELLDYFQSLPVQERNELQGLWGLSAPKIELYLQEANQRNFANPNTAGNYDDVAVTHRDRRPSVLRRTVNAISGTDDLSIFEDVLGDIITVSAIAEKEALLLATLSPEQQGRRLLVLFQKDLLTNISGAGEIMEKKSMQGKMVDMKPLSKWKKVLAYMFIASLDLGLLLYILLFAINQDRSRQMAWILSYLVWLVLEVVVVSSLVMVMSEFVVPSLMLADVKLTKSKMMDAVYGYQSKLLGTSAKETAAVTDFNAAPYLYMACRLAAKFPHSLESEIIQDFRTNLPKRTYKRVKNTAMDMYRKQLRLTAVTLTLLSLERCIYDLVCWALIGFFMLWQAVIFNGNGRLAVVVYTSVCVVLGVLVYYFYRTACRHRTKSRVGIIAIKSGDALKTPLMRDDGRRRVKDRKQSVVELQQQVATTLDSLRKASMKPNVVNSAFAVQSTESNNRICGEKVKDNAVIATASESKQLTMSNKKDSMEMLFNLSMLTEDENSHQDLCGTDESAAIDDNLNKILRRCESARLQGVDNCSDDGNSSDDSYANDEALTIDATRRTFLAKKVVEAFSKPLRRDTLASRIRRNREAIRLIGLKQQARGIEDSFVLNFEKRRSSLMAHQSRAQAKLLKRRLKQKTNSTENETLSNIAEDTDVEEEKESKQASFSSQLSRAGSSMEDGGNIVGGATQTSNLASQSTTSSRVFAGLKKLSSFEVFVEKKERIKNYTAHQALRDRALEAQRQEAKVALEIKKNSKIIRRQRSGGGG